MQPAKYRSAAFVVLVGVALVAGAWMPLLGSARGEVGGYSISASPAGIGAAASRWPRGFGE